MSAKTADWQDLQKVLAGSFSASASGVLEPRLILVDREGKEFGRLEVNGSHGAVLEAGPVRAEIEGTKSAGKTRYLLFSGGGELLFSEATRAEESNIECGGANHRVRMSPLRNFAEAVSQSGRTARVEGGFLGRRYEVALGEDECALPVAVFLLYHLFVTRSRAYRTNLEAGTGE